MATLDVAAILAELGIVVTRQTGDELYALCPGHLARTGKPDSRASWSINERSFAHHCFSCGYSGGLQTLYMDQTGEVPEDLVWQITKASVQGSAFSRLSPEDLPEVPEDTEEEEPVDVSEWGYNQYVAVPEKLLALRHITAGAATTYGVRWDKVKRQWVLPITTPEGELIGYQFRQKGVELNLPKGIEKSECLFGFWELTNYLGVKDRITIVESPLDAVRMFTAGIPCVSSYGAFVSEAQLTLLARNFRTVVCAMDNDTAGQKATEYVRRALHGKVTVWELTYAHFPKAKDPGDVADHGLLHAAWTKSQSLQITHPL